MKSSERAKRDKHEHEHVPPAAQRVVPVGEFRGRRGWIGAGPAVGASLFHGKQERSESKATQRLTASFFGRADAPSTGTSATKLVCNLLEAIHSYARGQASAEHAH